MFMVYEATAAFSTKVNYTRQSINLYKYLMRQCERLPKGPKEHYRHMIKQSYKQHINEADPQRIKQIVKRAYEDSNWIVDKYLGKK